MSVARIFLWGGAYFKNRDQIKFWDDRPCKCRRHKALREGGGGGEGGSGSCSPGKILKFEKYIEIVNPTITTLFCIILNFLQSH